MQYARRQHPYIYGTRRDPTGVPGPILSKLIRPFWHIVSGMSPVSGGRSGPVSTSSHLLAGMASSNPVRATTTGELAVATDVGRCI